MTSPPRRFANTHPDVVIGNFPWYEMVWRSLRGDFKPRSEPAGGYAAFARQWTQPVDPARLAQRQQAPVITWLGHVSMLLQVAGLNVLIDPTLCGFAGPLGRFGAPRRVPAPLAPEDLPPIDVVIFSHNHYDHLDNATVRKLLRRFPQVQFMVPLGMKRWLEKRGAHFVEELDWWEERQFGELTLSAVPARHWSMRTPWDRNQSLWCGWVVSHPLLRFYFSGDSGYSNQFEKIGQRLGPFDLAAIPIGAYAPRWFMSAQHMDPQQAVDVFSELRCHKAVPIHWGVFELADESLDQPLKELAQAISESVSPDIKFSPLKIGASITKE